MSEIDLKIENSELRTDSKMIRLESRMDHMEGKIDALSLRMDDKFAALMATIEDLRRHMLTPTQALIGAFTLFIGIVGTVIAVMSYGGERADAGYGVGSAVESSLIEYKKESDARFEKTDQTLEEIKQLIRAQSVQPGPAAK